MFIITNAFSINMLADGGHDLSFRPLHVTGVKNLLANAQWQSAVGHPDTAAVFSAVLGLEVAANRVNVELTHDVSLIVGQYRGPRLPEGATELPAGATIEWWQVYHNA